MRKAFALILTVSVIFSCNQETKVTTPSGYEITKIRVGNGKMPAHGEFMLLNLKYEDDLDSVYFDTSTGDKVPVQLRMDSVQWGMDDGSVAEIMKYMAEGDSVTFTLSMETVFSSLFKVPMPPDFENKDGKMTFYACVSHVLTAPEYGEWRGELEQKMMEKSNAMRADKILEEGATIDAYLKEKNLSASSTEKGVRIVVEREGEGALLQSGDNVKINYTGYVLNGQHFDSSVEAVAKEQGMHNPGRTYAPYEVIVEKSAVIEGWHDVLVNMKAGSKVTAYIPSPLGYGERTQGPRIPANSILVFEMEAVEVVLNNENEKSNAE